MVNDIKKKLMMKISIILGLLFFSTVTFVPLVNSETIMNKLEILEHNETDLVVFLSKEIMSNSLLDWLIQLIQALINIVFRLIEIVRNIINIVILIQILINALQTLVKLVNQLIEQIIDLIPDYQELYTCNKAIIT